MKPILLIMSAKARLMDSLPTRTLCIWREKWGELLMILLFAMTTVYILYHFYLHTLAKYPGPLLSRVTTARAAYHAWKGDLHLDMLICHRKYGPVVRYAPNHLIFESSAALKDIYSAGQNVSKPQMYQGLKEGQANILNMSDKKEHSRRRRLLGRGFTESSLRVFTPKLVQHIQRFCARINRASQNPALDRSTSSHWGHPINMADWCSYLTFDVMCDFIFGVNYNLLESEEYRHVIDDLEDANLRTAVLLWAPYLYIGRLDKILFRQSARGLHRFLGFLKQLIADSSVHREIRQYDIFAYLNSLKEGREEKLGNRQVLSESSILIVAGYDTTATALCATIFYLSRSPHAYARLSSEIRSRFASAAEITSPRQLESCTYLAACIDEALRMSPPVASCLFREVGTGGIIVDSHPIPAGVVIGNGVYSLHRSPRNFERADEFIPERWLTESQDLQGEVLEVSGSKSAFAPFCTGPRACIGKTFALMELSMTVAVLLARYDFKVASGEDGLLGAGSAIAGVGRGSPTEFQLYDQITGAKRGPVIQLRPVVGK